MKKIAIICVLLLTALGCSQEVPTRFSDEALNDTFITLEGESVTLKEILGVHKDKTIVVDIWASWCKDCIQGMPKVRLLQKANPDAAFVFLSLDRGQDPWKRGIKKYKVKGEHYYLSNGKKSAFGDFVDIDWIPRYMVVDSEGNIKMFKAVEADDEKIKQNL